MNVALLTRSLQLKSWELTSFLEAKREREREREREKRHITCLVPNILQVRKF
jgi:hypothetical protein